MPPREPSGGAAATNASIMVGGTGMTSAAINGMMTIAATATVWTAIETGTVYHLRLPTFTEDSTMSPNRSRGTVYLPFSGLSPPNPSSCAARAHRSHAKGGDYSQSKNSQSNKLMGLWA